MYFKALFAPGYKTESGINVRHTDIRVVQSGHLSAYIQLNCLGLAVFP